MTAHWAILIGIDFYKDYPLKGAVQDVQLIRQFLESSSTPIHITTLTASTPSDHNNRNPTENPDILPTYKIVTSLLYRLADEAAQGDFVYIHYSGHGARTYSDTKASNNNTGDLALVLFDAIFGTRYLRGMELNFFLKRMVDKGLFVTLVFDCCFSGSVLRQHRHEHDLLLRGLDYDPKIDAVYPPEVNDSGNGPFRNASLTQNWLVNANGYTILTACGPHEKAFELNTASGTSHGALSFFLLSTLTSLRRRGVSITHQSLHQHLGLIFHVNWPRQHPMRYGNGDFSFFDGLISQPDLSFVPVVVKDERLTLGAGYAHGVHDGDEYAVYPLGSPEGMSERAMAVAAFERVKVVWVGGLTSMLEGNVASSTAKQGKTELKARLLTRLSPWKASVRVCFHLNGLAEWIEKANQNPILRLSAGEESDTGDLFSVKRNENDDLEICSGSGATLLAVPTTPLESAGALSRVLHSLEHLATWKYFEGIQNRMPTPLFDQLFKISVNPPLGQSGLLEVKDEGIISVTVQNLGDKPLYLAIFDMGPSWQIENLFSQSGGGDCKVILPKSNESNGKEMISLRMTIPGFFKGMNKPHCEDIIKLFITNVPSPFPAMELPDLPTSLARLQDSHRSAYDHVTSFLASLATRFRSSDLNTIDEKWMAYNVIVRTHAT